MTPDMSVKIVGIAGPSCSGKSTVTELVAKELDGHVVSLDFQFIPDLPKIYVNGVRSFERPELFNYTEIVRIVTEWKKSGRSSFRERRDKQYFAREIVGKQVLILEGFLLLAYPQIRDMCDAMFYMDISWQESVRRRSNRPRNPQADAGYALIAEHEITHYVAPQKVLPNVRVLDGNQLPEQLAREILRICKQ